MKKHFFVTLSLALPAIMMPVASQAQVVVAIRVAPPVIPVVAVEEMPVAPAPGYFFTPGYWAYGDAGYYWVPGAWVQPPAVGLLWTPGYWGFVNGVYAWNEGYWGPHIGYYGGVNYGFGYVGVGFLGGVWAGSVFRYNTAVLNVGPGFHDVYVDRAAIGPVGARVSFNGPGGLVARPTAGERLAEHDHHVGISAAQRDHAHAAGLDRANRFSENHGRPAGARAAAEHRAAEHGAAEHRAAEHGAAEHRAAAEHGAARGGAARPGGHGEAARGGAARGGEHASTARGGAARPGGHGEAARGGAARGGEHAGAARGGAARGGAAAPRGGAGAAKGGAGAAKGGAGAAKGGGAAKGAAHK